MYSRPVSPDQRPPDARQRLLNDAWIGDAVLSLYARLKILREGGNRDGGKLLRLTSNQFLGIAGQPDAVEAELGRIYRVEGEAAAFRWIEERLVPAFERLEAKRNR